MRAVTIKDIQAITTQQSEAAMTRRILAVSAHPADFCSHAGGALLTCPHLCIHIQS